MLKVLITSDYKEEGNSEELMHGPYSVTTDYEVFPLHQAGYVPILLPAVDLSDKQLEAIVEDVDLVVMTGGFDVDPINYGEELKSDTVRRYSMRDQTEFRLIKAAIKAGKGIFGLCRGMQVLNVFFEGSLYQDLKESGFTDLAHMQNFREQYSLAHKVSIVKDSLLYNIMKSENILVNSFHHQGVKKLGKGLKATATSSDGLIEAFEHEKYPIMAVQWHPEVSYKSDLNSKKLFEGLTRLVKKS